MKSLLIIIILCSLINFVARSEVRYWVGPLNGSWGNTSNWSNSEFGSPGAGIPGSQDSVIFSDNSFSLVNINMSPTIASLQIQGNVTMYTSISVSINIIRSFRINYERTLKDSTASDVAFNVVFHGSTFAKADIVGNWVFEGRVMINDRLTSGATFNAEPGSLVTVLSENYGKSYDFQNYKAGQIIFKKYTGTIKSNKTSLVFTYNTSFILDKNMDATIPAATWFGDELTQYSYSGTLQSPASSIQIRTDAKKISFEDPVLDLAKLVIDLPELSQDLNLDIPDGSTIRGNLEVYNTNNHKLILLSNDSSGSDVEVTLGVSGQKTYFGGNFLISGANTKVALANSSAASSAKNYKLLIFQSFKQSGGNFSLQDFDDATGSSTVEIRNDLYETAGTFFTNSNSTAARFKVVMGNPTYITGPSGSFQSLRSIGMSSGTIDNGNHKIILRIKHGAVVSQYYPSNLTGILLETPLTVGRLELVGAPITTSTSNVLTVSDPSIDAISLGDSKTCCITTYANEKAGVNYINGPLRRATNSTGKYLFPVGSGNHLRPDLLYTNIKVSYHFDSCYIIPITNEQSLYQVEYAQSGYTSQNAKAPLTGTSSAEYWNVNKIVGADVAAQLFLSDEAVPGVKAEDALAVARYVDGNWVAENVNVLTPGNSSTGFVTSKSVVGGLFTFGYGNAASLEPPAGPLFDGLNYQYYEGGFSVMPNFNNLTPVKTGNTSNIDLSIRRSGIKDSFAMVWKGYINIPTAGSYTFETISDDGSKFYFNSLYNPAVPPLIDNDSTHPPRSVTGIVNIDAAGRYPITITYFENYGAESMQLFWTGPGIPRQQVPDAAFTAGNTPPANTSGLTYKYYEGSFDVLPNFNMLTPVNTGTSPNIDINLRPAGVNDNFAFTWEGMITIPATGNYTFETVSDDGSKLSLNGNMIVNNDGLHALTVAIGIVTLSAGTYPISISYFEKNGGETMQVYWSGPGIPRELIPNAAFSTMTAVPPATSRGLTYKYYEGDFNTLPDFSQLTPVKSGTSANADISIRPSGVNDHFAFVWEGTITLPSAGTYIFETISDDGSKVYFNSNYSQAGNSLINNDGLHPAISATGTISVPSAGTYPIIITYFQKEGGETMQLFWTGPGIERQLIPDAAFGSETTPTTSNSGGLVYQYYEGDFNMLPDYSTLVPVKTGISQNVDISVRNHGVNDHFAFVWSGYINLPSAGIYTFETISDDGSKVYFNIPYSTNGASTVNNDGLHAQNSATGTVVIPSGGKYPVSITFFEKDGGETMQLYWSGPGISRQLIPDAAFSTTNEVNEHVAMSGSTNRIVNQIAEINRTKVYPNPFADKIIIDYYNLGTEKKSIEVSIYDVTGKMVCNYKPSGLTTGMNRWTLNFGTEILRPGVYFAQVKVNGMPINTIKLSKIRKL